MCVKQAEDDEIVEGDLTAETFNGLKPIIGGLNTLIFSGIGEPLLHPSLVQFMGEANQLLPAKSTLGLQTNGHLLTAKKLDTLLDAGLNKLCVSVDGISPETFNTIRAGGKIGNIFKVLDILKQAKSDNKNTDFNFGVEFVLMKQNYQDLPGVIRMAAEYGASFTLVTNVIPYDKPMESECLYNPNTRTSVDFYDRWKKEADERNLDLDKYLKERWKYSLKFKKTSKDLELMEFGSKMVYEAYVKRIPLHLPNLTDKRDEIDQQNVAEVMDLARTAADESGIELTLPELNPKNDRQCHFIEDGSTFVDWKGKVYPCYFLWHQYLFVQNGRKLKVTARSFGNIQEQEVTEIWNSNEFSTFREKVLKYDYPFCENCMLGPCPLFTEKEFEYDCYAKDIPCGTCPWCGGLMHCLS